MFPNHWWASSWATVTSTPNLTKKKKPTESNLAPFILIVALGVNQQPNVVKKHEAPVLKEVFGAGDV